MVFYDTISPLIGGKKYMSRLQHSAQMSDVVGERHTEMNQNSTMPSQLSVGSPSSHSMHQEKTSNLCFEKNGSQTNGIHSHMQLILIPIKHFLVSTRLCNSLYREQRQSQLAMKTQEFTTGTGYCKKLLPHKLFWVLWTMLLLQTYSELKDIIDSSYIYDSEMLYECFNVKNVSDVIIPPIPRIAVTAILWKTVPDAAIVLCVRIWSIKNITSKINLSQRRLSEKKKS